MKIIHDGQQSLALKALASKGKPFLKLTAKDVANALKAKYPSGGQWVLLFEVGFGTGFTDGSDNHIDAMAFNCWPSDGTPRLAFEIKVSREDFKKELRDPLKRANAVQYSNEFYFVVPKGLVDPFDVPEECGLMEVREDLSIRTSKPAPWRREAKFDYKFFLAAVRKAIDLSMTRSRALVRFHHDQLRALNDFPDIFEEVPPWKR